MIKTFFGLSRNPFAIDEDSPLMEHQQRHFDILKVHTQQGGFCLILGEPGTGKTVLKNAIIRHDPTRMIPLVINRIPHTWSNLLRLLCQGLQLETAGTEAQCATRLTTEVRKLNAMGKVVILIKFCQRPPSDRVFRAGLAELRPYESSQRHGVNSAANVPQAGFCY